MLEGTDPTAGNRSPNMTRITFVSHDGTAETIEAEVGQSVMDAAKRHGINGIEAMCGGACACATCHVLVDDEWLGSTAFGSYAGGKGISSSS